MRQLRRLAFFAAALGALASLPAAADTIKLGAVLPLTGPAAVVGTQEQSGIQYAVDEVNAKGGIAQGNRVNECVTNC